MKPYVYRYNSSSSLAVAFGAAYADVAGIAPWIAAGSVMRFRGFFTYTVSAATVGVIPALNGPTASVYMGRFSVQTNANGTSTHVVHNGYRPGTVTGATTGAATGTAYGVMFDGFFAIGSSGGGLAVSFKGAGTAGTATVASGGTLLLEQIL